MAASNAILGLRAQTLTPEWGQTILVDQADAVYRRS